MFSLLHLPHLSLQPPRSLLLLLTWQLIPAVGPLFTLGAWALGLPHLYPSSLAQDLTAVQSSPFFRGQQVPETRQVLCSAANLDLFAALPAPTSDWQDAEAFNMHGGKMLD